MNEQALPQSMEAFVITHGYRPHRNSVSLIAKAREVDTALAQAREYHQRHLRRCAALEEALTSVKNVIESYHPDCCDPKWANERCWCRRALAPVDALLQASGEKQ